MRSGAHEGQINFVALLVFLVALPALLVALSCTETPPSDELEPDLQFDLNTTVHLAGSPVHPNGGELMLDLTIGAVDGPDEYVLGRVSDAALGPAGQIYVIDRQAKHVREYDVDGAYVRTIGRPGEGPGEFDWPIAIAVSADGTIHVGEYRYPAVHRFSADGAFLHKVPFERSIDGPFVVDTAGILFVRFASADRTAMPWFAGLASIDSVPDYIFVSRPGGRERTQGGARLAADGTVIDTIRAPDRGDHGAFVAVDDRGGRIHLGLPYLPETWWAWSPLGYLVTGDNERYEIELRVPPATGQLRTTWLPGDPVVRIQREVERVPVGDDESVMLQNQIDRLVQQMAESNTWHGPTEPPATKPAYHGFVVALDGRIWVFRPTVSQRIAPDVNRWTEASTLVDIFEPDGTFVGTVTGPVGNQPAAIRGDTVIARARNELDVDVIRRYVVQWRE